MALSKSHKARLKRVENKIDKALDSAAQAAGELWPKDLRPYAERLHDVITELRAVQSDVERRLQDRVVPGPKEPEEVDPDQEDFEDLEGVAQPQPEPARRPAARDTA